MNRKDLYRSFNGIDEEILERSEQTVSKVIPLRRRMTVLLVAALVAVFLMGAGVVAVIYGDSIQSWFSHYFDLVTGQEMSEGQKALIDHLSQDISLSQTIGETTLTVDSMTMGDDIFYVLLRIEGISFSKRHDYFFEKFKMEVSPDVVEEAGGLGSYDADFLGLDGDGAMLVLIEHTYGTGEEFSFDTRPLNVHLVFENLMRNPMSHKKKMMTEGVWEFTFTVDRTQPPMSVSLPDTEVVVMNRHTKEEVSTLLTNIELTNTGIHFRYDYSEGTLAVDKGMEVLLDNGATIWCSDGISVPMADEKTLNCTHHWKIPVNLKEVKAVRIGNVEIPVEY